MVWKRIWEFIAVHNNDAYAHLRHLTGKEEPPSGASLHIRQANAMEEWAQAVPGIVLFGTVLLPDHLSGVRTFHQSFEPNETPASEAENKPKKEYNYQRYIRTKVIRLVEGKRADSGYYMLYRGWRRSV